MTAIQQRVKLLHYKISWQISCTNLQLFWFVCQVILIRRE